MAQLELDPELNYSPDHIETIHLIGVCGTGMGSLAGMLAEKGYKVTGSDQNVYPPMSDFLAASGIPVAKGYAPENLDHMPDLVIVGNVVTRRNPEAPRLKELGIPYISFPQALRMFFLKDKKPIVAAGTHGKTTTSSLCAWLLDRAGMDPGFMIGGIVGNYGGNFRLGSGDWFVVEGDEYDSAFFNKVPKFVHYMPYIGILTSVEFDHADIYPNLDAVIEAFRCFVKLIPEDGLLVACGDDPLVRRIAGEAVSDVLFYGLGETCDWRAANLSPNGRTTRFEAVKPDGSPCGMVSPLPGEHNVLNTLAAAVVLDRVGVRGESLKSGLESFKGVKRRQEVRGVEAGITVIDDFAHHPTAVKKTVEAIRTAYRESLGGGRLVAVFEPRTNTSRRDVFQRDYAGSFDPADLILIREPAGLDKINEDERFSSPKLVDDLKERGKKAVLFRDTDAILDYLGENLKPGDVVLIMSNGGFDNIHVRLLELLRKR